MQTSDPTSKPVFRPRRGLSNAHLQTLAGNFLPRENGLPLPEERLFQVEEDVQVLCHCHWQKGEDKHRKLTVILVHGLEGSSESQYVIGLGTKAWRRGMNVVRMNMRNCGGTEELTPTLYHSGLSSDVGAVARTLIEQDGLSQLALVGYSMGGNLVLKLAGEWAHAAPAQLRAVAAVSPAIDLSPSADALHQASNRIYEWKFLLGLRRRYRRKVRLFPERYDSGLIKGWRSIREFDDLITAPYSGFQGAEDYYQRASASRVIDRIAIPALVICSLDDPFIRVLPQTREKLISNPKILYLETQHGGHCAFLESANGYDGRWAEKTVVEFFTRQQNPS